MSNEDKDAAKANAEEIKDEDALQTRPRGNVYSEPGEKPQHEAPPPLAH